MPGQQLGLVADLRGGAGDGGRRPVGRARVEAVADAEAVGVGGHDLDVERGDAELVGDELRVLGLAAVGARWSGSAPSCRSGGCAGRLLCRPRWPSPALLVVGGSPTSRDALALLMGGQRVVLLEVAEGGLRPAQRMRRHRRALAARVDAGLGPQSSSVTHPGVVLPLLGPWPLGMATELPGHRHGAGPRLGLVRDWPAGAVATGGGSHVAAPIAAATSPSASKLWPLTSASQCGSAATMPPACTENALALTRGLTHTIRWASRARRAISRPTSVGSPRSQPSERITTTAPRAMPRRPWRSLNALSASPIRVPLDQSGRGGRGALDGALGVARGQRAGQAGQPRGEHEGLGVRPAAGGAGQELQVGARVGLHRARDVAQHHQPAAGDAAPAAREADRVAAGAQAGAQRAAQVDVLAVAPLLVAARAPPRRLELQARHQAVELGELEGLERVEALAGQALLVAGHRHRHLDLGAVVGALAPPGSGRGGRARLAAHGPMLAPRLVVGRRGDGDGGDLVEVEALIGQAIAEDGAEDAVEGGDLRGIADEHGACRPVQPPAADRAHERQRACEVGQPRRASSARRRRAGAGRTRRRTRAGRARSSRTPKARASATAAHELLEAGRADHLLVLAVLEHRAERPVDRAGVQALDAEQAQGREPVDRLGDARRLLHVGVAHARDGVGHLHGQRLRRALDRAGARSPPRARASGRRSSDTGSGA